MDVLADVLRASRLGNSILSQSELMAPFGLEVGPDVRAAVHVVQRGTCWLRLGTKGKPRRLGVGDVVLIPRGVRHVLSDAPRSPAEPYERALEKMRTRLARLGSESGRERVTLLCAEIKFELGDPHPLMSVLPEVIHLARDASENDDDLQSLCRLLLREAKGGLAGSEIVVPRLIDTLLVFVVRRWLDHQPLKSAGWLGALRDPQVGEALGLIHEAPQYRWTVAELAARVAMSRAVFARRFVALVGEPPLTYVTRWRMNLAAKALRSTEDSVERVAALVGYDSSTAFGNAFRRHLSISPGQYRLKSRAGNSA